MIRDRMVRRILFLAISIAAVLGVARHTVIAAGGDLQEEVLKAEDARNQALPKGDVPALEKIFADDLIYTNATGSLLTKTQHLADLKGRRLSVGAPKSGTELNARAILSGAGLTYKDLGKVEYLFRGRRPQNGLRSRSALRGLGCRCPRFAQNTAPSCEPKWLRKPTGFLIQLPAP